MTNRFRYSSNLRLKGVCLLAFLITGCSVLGPVPPPWKAAVAGDGPGDPELLRSAAVVVENLPKSRRGNPPVYSVFGQAYRVMDSANNFREWGVASWYGKKFHGRETSSGEIYDMHALTAAHKHLPLPTFVRVTRVDNGRSIVVKVNDRGPFVDDRIIDLSYAAAAQLDMLGMGKADVFIEALSSHNVDEPIQQAAVQTVTDDWIEVTSTDLFIQVGAFSEVPNAQRMLEKVRNVMNMPVAIAHDQNRALHRVRIGPLSDEQMVSDTINSLALAGIDSYTMVSENP